MSAYFPFQFSRSVVSDSLWPHESQHTRPPCPSPTPGVHSNSRPLSRCCHPAISSSVVPFSSCPQSLPASGSFSNESALHMKWPKYWSFSFSISPSKEYPGLISFRMGWLDLILDEHHRLHGHEFGWIPGVGDGQGGLVCCDSWGHKESDTTERLNWYILLAKEHFLRE